MVDTPAPLASNPPLATMVAGGGFVLQHDATKDNSKGGSQRGKE
jgi:hypothetical protein